ncbi:MAG TPA: DUF2802 domain-containing protein [Rhodocyclaceae bacterium]
MDLGALTLRDAVLAVIGLLGVYLVVMVLRLLQLRRRRAPAPATARPPVLEDDEGDVAFEEPVYAAPVARPAPTPAGDFGAEVARSRFDAETRQLREEVAQLREEIGQLRSELADLKAARLVSPQYAEAMTMAQRGLTAQDLADRCGISLGEAELVWALSRGATHFDQEEDYGGESGAEHARSA